MKSLWWCCCIGRRVGFAIGFAKILKRVKRGYGLDLPDVVWGESTEGTAIQGEWDTIYAYSEHKVAHA